MRKRVLVRGPGLTQSGYGEHTRFLLRSLRKHENLFDIFFQNLNWGKTNWLWQDDEERRWMDHLLGKTHEYQGAFDMTLQVTIPNEFERLSPVDIGVTAGIETNKISAAWIEKCNQMNKIITISEHSKKGITDTSYEATNKETGQVINDFKVQVPVDIVHYPAKVHEPKSIDLDLDYDFNFLTVAQWSPRKDIENTVRWFVEEFHDKEVGLVLKTSLAKNCLYDRRVVNDRLKRLLDSMKRPDRKCKVYLLHGYMLEEEMSALYNHEKIKCYVTSTHGEGFGLPLFEAACEGLPIIAPSWSGHVDFLYAKKKNKKGRRLKNTALFTEVEYTLGPIMKESVWEGVLEKDSMWCYVDPNSFKSAMRGAINNIKNANKLAKELQKHVLENFNADKQYDIFAKSVLGKEYLEPKNFDGISFCITTDGKKVEKTNKVIDAIKSQMTTKDVEIVISGVTEPFEDVEGVVLAPAVETAQTGFLAELRNIAARKSTKDVICYMDDDMLLPPTWLWRLEEYSSNFGWNILGNRILNPDGSRFWDRAVMQPHVLVGYGHPCDDPNLYQTGGFSVHRKEVFEKHQWNGKIPINNLEKNGDGVNEDIEYYTRLQKEGYLIHFDPENVTWHWDDRYVQAQLPNGNSQTLLKSVIEEHAGPQNFPPRNGEFLNLLSMLGVEEDGQ